MSMRMASFLAGVGGGYLEGSRRAREEDRQAKIDARAEEEFNRKKTEWKDADQLKADLKDAALPRVEQQGVMTEGQSGGIMQRTFNQNPEEAQRVKSMMDAEAEMTGVAPATQQQTSAVTGNMALGHQIGKTMGADANSTDSVAQRTAAAYRKNGLMDKAIGMENAVMDSKLKKLGLSTAEAKFADEEFNRKLTKDLDAHPDWTVGAAKILTESQVGGLNGMTVSARPSKDGKSVDFVGVGQDGAEKVLKSFKSGADGKAEFLQTAGRTSFENKLSFVVERAKSDQAQSNWEKTFKLSQNADARASEQHKVVMADAKVPAAVKLQAAALAEELKSVNAAMAKAMAEDKFDPNSANAKALLERQATINIQYQNILNPYVSASKSKVTQESDPAGILSTPENKNAIPTDTKPPNQIAQPVSTPKPEYVPPAGSPAAKAKQNQENLRLQSMQRIQSAMDAANAAILSGDPIAADAVRGTPEFMNLPRATKERLNNIIFGR